MQSKPAKTTVLAGFALFAWLTGCTAESHSGDQSGALRGGEGGTGGKEALGPQSYSGTRGDVWITDAQVPETPVQPPQAPQPDAGEPPIEVVDAGTQELPPEAQPFCGPGSDPGEWLTPGNAGDGTTSGCAPKVCQGMVPPTGDELDRMLNPTQPVLGPERYDGCTEIEGDLIISNYQGTDLSELSCLEYVNGTVLIWYSPGLTSLGGLESLRFVMGDMRIGYAGAFLAGNDALTRLDPLARLEGVGDSLVIHGTALTSLEGLGGVRAVAGSLTIAIPWGLSDLTGLSSLERIGGDLDLWRFEGPTSLAGLEALRSIGGSFMINNSDKLVGSPGGLPNVTCIGGMIDFSGHMDWAPNAGLVNADFLPALDRVGGDVLVHIQPQLRAFSILQNVTYVRGSLYLQGNPLLTAVPLPSLQHIDGLYAHDNPQLDGCPLLDLGTALGATAVSISGNADDCVAP